LIWNNAQQIPYDEVFQAQKVHKKSGNIKNIKYVEVLGKIDCKVSNYRQTFQKI
jgi:hypothetical protein